MQKKHNKKQINNTLSCPYCGSEKFLFSKTGERNNFCGKCGQEINWELKTEKYKVDWSKNSNWVIVENAQEILKAIEFASKEEPYHIIRKSTQTFLDKISENNKFRKSETFLIIPIFSQNSSPN